MTARAGDRRLTFPATEIDAADVHALTRQVWTAHADLRLQPAALQETVDDVAGELRQTGGLVVREGVGGPLLAAVRFSEHDSGFWLRRLAVRADVRREGLATHLADVADSVARDRGYDEIRIRVRAPLRQVTDFWRRLGFHDHADHGHWVELARPVSVVLGVPTAADMHRLGRRLAELLRAGDLVVLTGDLGAGKTTLTRGVGEGLGVRGAVTSPTFVIARVHPSTVGGPALVHVDAYRLESLAEVDDLDLDASVSDSVTVVEWGQGKVEDLTESRLEMEVRRSAGDGDESRTVVVRPRGGRWSAADMRRLTAGDERADGSFDGPTDDSAGGPPDESADG